jgi:hypothetical protein
MHQICCKTSKYVVLCRYVTKPENMIKYVVKNHSKSKIFCVKTSFLGFSLHRVCTEKICYDIKIRALVIIFKHVIKLSELKNYIKKILKNKSKTERQIKQNAK